MDKVTDNSEENIWDNYKAPEIKENTDNGYPGLSEEKIRDAFNEVFNVPGSVSRLGGLDSGLGGLGSGIFGQMSAGNIHKYNQPSLEDLEDAIKKHLESER